MVQCGSCRRRRAGKSVTPDQNGHMAGVFGQKDALFRRGKSSANHEHILSGKEFSVAGRAVSNAPPAPLFFPFKSDFPRMCTRSQQHAEAVQVSPAGPDGLNIAAHVKASHFRQQELRPEVFRLPAHGLRQRFPAGAFHAREVHHLMGDRDLSAETLFFHHQHPVSGTGKIQGGGQPCRAADHYSII